MMLKQKDFKMIELRQELSESTPEEMIALHSYGMQQSSLSQEALTSK
jgi:hypothetical protein